MNSNISVTKQTNRNIYIEIVFQNSIERLSFLYRITDIYIARINPCLQNNCSKKFFAAIPGRPTSVLKKNSTLDVLLESMQSMQKFSEQLFFLKRQWTDASECSNSLFLEHQWTPLNG